jgi:hypothetical protein
MLNPFFQQGSRSEQNLVQDLINEQLRMYGVEVYYIPRRYLTKNTVIEEVIQSEFNNAYPIEAYVNNFDGYDGQGTLLSKFGIQDIDDLTLIISKDRYENYITPLIKDLPNIELSTRPKEGDLIYFPLGQRLFEIKFVEHEQPFYQLQKNYVYELRCELFRYGSEVLDTGVDEIDTQVQEIGYIRTYTVSGIGETASAYTGIVNGALGLFTISATGYGYNAPITLGISTAPSGGIDAVGIVTGRTTIGSGGDQYLTIQGIELTNPGAGYTVAPLVTFSGKTTGVGAEATVGIVTTGAVGVITVTSVGSNYIEEPTVTFSSPVSGGTTATGRAILANDNTISAVRITNPGSGYTIAPNITFSLPNQIGSGNFVFNEIVTGSSSGSKARVKDWNASDKKLQLSNISGEFLHNEIVIGETSGAQHKIVILNTITTNPLIDDSSENDQSDDEFNLVEAYDENDVIQSEADDILDFTERNPFGRV